jgi:hypothetical protein
VEVREIAGRHGEDRACARADRSGRRDVLDAGEGRRRDGRRGEHARLATHSGGDPLCGGVGADGPLPVDRNALHRALRHRPERVADEEQHRGEQRDGQRKRDEPSGGASRRADEADDGEPGESRHALRCSRTIRPS